MKRSILNPPIIVASVLVLITSCISLSVKEIDRDGRFIAYDTGVVKDVKTGLEWVVGPDRNMTWDHAKGWAQSLGIDGGGWRLPTVDELEALYEKGRGSRNMTRLIKPTGWHVWSGKSKGPSYAWGFTFLCGYSSWERRDSCYYDRALAVRSR